MGFRARYDNTAGLIVLVDSAGLRSPRATFDTELAKRKGFRCMHLMDIQGDKAAGQQYPQMADSD